MRVFSHKNRLPLSDVAKHADVTVVAGPIENITGGSSTIDAFEEAVAINMRKHPGVPILNLLGT